MTDKAYYTTKELAELAARRGRPVTQEYIRQQCKRGDIKADQPGRDWLIPSREAFNWLDNWIRN